MVDGIMPASFWDQEDGGEKFKGGVEYGFLSTSCKKEVAQQYAHGKAGTILEIKTGMVDRGADLKMISQYPHEEEICFPPLTCLEVIDMTVEGKTLWLNMRLNVNFTAETIER